MCEFCGDPNCRQEGDRSGGRVVMSMLEIDHHKENVPHRPPPGAERCDIVAQGAKNQVGKFRVAVFAVTDKGRETLAGLLPPDALKALAVNPVAPKLGEPETWRTHRILTKRKLLPPLLIHLLKTHHMVVGLMGPGDQVQVVDGSGGWATLLESMDRVGAALGMDRPPVEGEEWKDDPKPAPKEPPVVEEILPPGFDRLLKRMRPDHPTNLN